MSLHHCYLGFRDTYTKPCVQYTKIATMGYSACRDNYIMCNIHWQLYIECCIVDKFNNTPLNTNEKICYITHLIHVVHQVNSIHLHIHIHIHIYVQ